MMNLLSDWMFLVAAVGVLVSGAALPLLVSRFRAAPAAQPPIVLPPSDEPEEYPDEPVKVLDEPEEDNKEKTKPQPVGPAKEEPVKAAEPKKSEMMPPPAEKKAEIPAEESTPRKFNTGATITGGISPAIAYLQNLKNQIEKFESEVHRLREDVAGFAKARDAQYKDLVQRISQMQTAVAQGAKSAAQSATPPAAVKPAPAAKPAPVAKPAPKPAPAPEPKPAEAKPAPVAVEKKLEPKTEPKAAPRPEPKIDVELTSSSLGTQGGIELTLAGEPDPSPAAPAPARAAPPPAASDNADSEAQAIADTLKVDLGSAGPPAEPEVPKEIPKKSGPKDAGDDDILKPSGKGPVWPV